jgi:superfamily II DNA or RNA helicase
MYHVNDKGDVLRCRATVKACRFELHGETQESTRTLYETSVEGSNVQTLTKASAKSLTEASNGAKTPGTEFDKATFYGKQSPRDIQLDALNGVVEALEEGDATQLVAACGTGKTFMHRQLLREAMEKDGSNGIGVILTSSIKLAQDTASDLRPEGGYDESIGKFGEDYEVVEVHSGATGEEGRQSVKANGVISVDRIYNQISEALESGKKVVIVSTYDSVSKVQEAQALFENQDRVQADLLIHDESHNILGQQRPTTVASDENELTAYVGFHNDIPGSLQARKRLYSTATPVVSESDSDKPSTGELQDLIEASKRMQAGEQFERLTVYSDDPMVGGVGGFISQHEAIANSCLAKPSYEVREAVLKGEKALSEFTSPVVDYKGVIHEKSDDATGRELSPKTYGAVLSTLNAMVADSDGEKNQATNVLAYVGSIKQSEGFKEEFKKIAEFESRGMSLSDAEALKNSPDADERRRARMKLLSEKAIVKAAHSGTDPASIAERREAFKMFDGNAVTSSEWTPEKRVLANVNIFSEGVSISEIDAVVISDDDKLNEKSMTQAIGRAIRVVPGNDVKKFGHVIIPAITDKTGEVLNSSSVNLAAYTSTRVERGSTASRLRGENITPDTTTSFTIYKANGEVSTELASKFAQDSVTSAEDLAAAAVISNNRTKLRNKDKEGFAKLTKSEQFTLAKQDIDDQISRLKKDNPTRVYLQKVRDHVHGKSISEIQEIARNGRVVTAALATGDISSINPSLATQLINKGIINTKQKAPELTVSEMRGMMEKYVPELSAVIMSTPTTATEEHLSARQMLPESLLKDVKTRSESFKSLQDQKHMTDRVREAHKMFNSALENDEFVKKAYSVMSKADAQAIPAFRLSKNTNSIKNDARDLDNLVLNRQHQAAVMGQQSYSVDKMKIRKTGELNVTALRELLND